MIASTAGGAAAMVWGRARSPTTALEASGGTSAGRRSRTRTRYPRRGSSCRRKRPMNPVVPVSATNGAVIGRPCCGKRDEAASGTRETPQQRADRCESRQESSDLHGSRGPGERHAGERGENKVETEHRTADRQRREPVIGRLLVE